MIGQRRMPVLGTIENRSDSFLLAEVRRTGQGIELRQRACGTRFKPVLGVKIEMPPAAVRRLPASTIRFVRGDGDRLHARPWSVAWAEQDLDGDGKPGVTIDVESPWCSGQIQVASRAVSQASGTLVDGGMDAAIEVVTDQRILAASAWCLRAGSKDERLEQRGQVRYRPVPAGTTCETLAARPWPVHVELPDQK
ncbi:MAG: hypothetical protein JXR83_22965 [Deltaproteobacteria bacterium]|nr:hypothetical protein [Deltaproteobacteria bacterium]